jgi:two-component system sensor histidine kinase HydH
MREQKYHKWIAALALLCAWLFLVALFLSEQHALGLSVIEEVWLSGILGASFMLLGVSLLLWSTKENHQQEKTRQQDEQLALLQQMSAVVAHELRNPLASAKGHSQLLAEMLEDGSRSQSKAEQVVREITRVESLTNDLLTFIRAGKIKQHRCDPAALVQEISQRVTDGLLHLSIEEAPSEWSLDAAAMERALLSLLRNAIQAQGDAELPIEIVVKQERGELYISVRDRGPGPIDGVDIFAPFVTTKINGAGLGLALARQIIQAHHGRLSLQKHPGGGAIAEIYIPMS